MNERPRKTKPTKPEESVGGTTPAPAPKRDDEPGSRRPHAHLTLADLLKPGLP